MITVKEYQKRRHLLANQLPKKSVAIIPAGHEQRRNGDSDFPFRQDSNFYYLTGFNEPEALLLIKSADEGTTYLLNRPRNPAEEQWTGKRLGQAEAPSQLKITDAFSIDSLATQLPELMKDCSAIYYSLGQYPQWDQVIFAALQQLKKQVRHGIKVPEAIIDLNPLLSELRLIKSENELNVLRQVALFSCNAHSRAIRATKHFSNEGQIEAELLYELRRQGCQSVAYTPIVGAGANACILHYTANNQPLRSGDLVLVDAGGELDNYAADITRTFPINGHFNTYQRAIYDLVLSAQKAGMDCIKPGKPWGDIQERIIHVLTEGLVELGILQGNPKQLVANQAYKPFYMHNSGHWLGLDVHDDGAYKITSEWRPLKPGMVLTIEPGLYLPAHLPGLDEKWWNIGVRIEDDIVVTEKGYENLTQSLPVEADAIEALAYG